VPPTIPSLFDAAERGDGGATDALFAVLYSELHILAKRELAKQGAPVSIGATTLLHQAYIDMAARDGVSFPDRARFMGYAARVMRGLIVDHARGRRAQKRGGQFHITSMPTDATESLVDERQLIEVGAALDELATMEPDLAAIVDLRFFCGFTLEEAAALQGINERTARRRWERARVYLHRRISADLSS
jgi:RNA polymerase sigma factor (TIGR02999 family)